MLSFKLVLRRAGEAPMTYSNRVAGKKPVVLRKLAGITALLFLFSSLSSSVLAQSGATITGRVTDERAGVVPGAEVRLRSRTGIRLFARTDEKGIYAFNGLAPGDYILEITARGFA